MRSHIVRSVEKDARVAAQAAIDESVESLGARPDFMLTFGTAGYDPEELLRTLAAGAPNAVLAGCSAEGVITQGFADETDYALGLLALRSERHRFRSFAVESYASDSASAGALLALQLSAVDLSDALAIIVFTDGLSGDCSAFLNALSTGLPRPIPIAGGAAGDALRMECTHQFDGQRALRGGATAVLVSGRGRVGIHVGHGCRPIGRRQVVTKAENGWVIEIENEPAWQHFRRYLAGDPQDLRADGIMHLSVGFVVPTADGGERLNVRTPMLLRQEDGALFFPGGGVTAGSKIRLLRRDDEQIRQDAVALAHAIVAEGRGRRPELVLQFDCSGRGKLLFGACAAKELVEPVQEIVGRDIPWLGFHTYGEIATIDGAPHYHNYSVVFLTFYEDEA